MQGRLRQMVCVSYVVKHTDDPISGSALVLLQGVRRAKVHYEIEHEPYRRVVVEPVLGCVARGIEPTCDA